MAIPPDPFSSVSRLRKLDLRNLLLAEEDSEFAGFTYYLIHRKPWFEPSIDAYATVAELHVRREVRNKGIGTKLLKKALIEISKNQVKVVYIDTGEDNPVALHIYRKAGFRDLRKHVKLKLELTR